MEFDEALKLANGFGNYQKFVLIFLFLSGAAVSSQIFFSVFTLPNVLHRCTLPDLQNDTFETQNEWHKDIINRSVPWDAKEDRYSSCKLYSSHPNTSISHNATAVKCSSWVFDHSTFETTVTEEFDVVCDRAGIKSHVQMMVMLGILVAAVLFGQVSDLIGRKKTLLGGLILMLLSGICCIFSTNIWIYAGLRLFNGACGGGCFVTMFTLGVELMDPSKRVYAAQMFQVWFAIGYLYLTLFAYFIPNWKTLHWASSIPWVVYLLSFWFIPESPRWLLGKGKRKEAEEVVRKIAKINGTLKNIPEDLFEEKFADKKETEVVVIQRASLIDVFKSRILCLRSLNIYFNWVVNVMVYYGLTMHAGNLAGSVYVNFTLSSLSELLAHAFVFFSLAKWGRKWPLCLTMIIGGLACISTLFVVIYGDPDNNSGHNAIMLVLSNIGKFCIAASFAIVYIFTAELFPTVVRNATLGAASTCARVGGVVSPYIADISIHIKTDFGKALPLVIFGSLSVAAGCLAMILPETHGKKLPETIEEGINFGRKRASPEDQKDDAQVVPLMVYSEDGDKMAANRE